jgi:hypothetical protein
VASLDICQSASSILVHVLAKTPAHPHQSVRDIVVAHGATDFLPALHSFLRTHLPNNTLVPGVQDRFDVYRQVIIVTPSAPQVSEAPMRRRIRATPKKLASGRKSGSPARFDMALISVGPRTSHLRTLDGRFDFVSSWQSNHILLQVCEWVKFARFSLSLVSLENTQELWLT